ncbi:MAG: 5'/3'-nucleotidase SurE [Acidobacteriota bacterium]
MELLLTNDDGIDAPGLAALVQAVGDLASFQVVAPREVQSGTSHSMMDRSPLRVSARAMRGMRTAHAVEGRPADCTRLGLRHYAPSADWVLSGINAGGNLGIDVYYSGTVGAAREAAILGKPAMAISQYIRDAASLDWDRSARWAGRVIRLLTARVWPAGRFLNVNLPQTEEETFPPVKWVPLAVDPHNVSYERSEQPDAISVFRYRGRYRDRPSPAGTDVHAVFSGSISITPLQLDATDVELLQSAGASSPSA